MDTKFYQSSGFSLITGSILIILTMVLHPSGGSIEHILEISRIITVSHALAIFSIPFILFGFYGLSTLLQDPYRLSHLALTIMALGLIAAMFAAVVNGLTLPYFLGMYADSVEANREVLRPIMSYGFALNKPLDYIFIAGCCISMLTYSVLIVQYKQLPGWLGYFGILFNLAVLVGVITGFVFTSLMGFRIFTFSLAGWVLISGIYLTRSKLNQHD